MPEPVELMEMRAMIAQARDRFRASVHAELLELLERAEPFALVIGEVGVSEALDAWREAAITALARRYRREDER